ncbi:MAG: hypothetical protein H8D87_06320 [Deltaproteobacteria bacterium]|uniref:hypothetical protein n=1 Tax=Desulfobacula sp. TaxID=2593537 RepID=UPI0019A426D8|nr:hypothetical protein [Candidatus Desulfobacula maris]MBL6994789.1 hypothetical protein [Desulfobacula sp.]
MQIIKQKKKTIRRKSPMPGMAKEARPVWTAIFKEYPPRHFSPAQYGLIRAFCEVCVLRNETILQLSDMGPLLKNKVTGGYQKNPLFQTVRKYEKSIRELHHVMDLKPELLDRFLDPEFKIVGKDKK